MDYLNKDKWIEDESGIRFAQDSVTETSFSDKTQNVLMNLEDDSWWFSYRADVIMERMNQYFSKKKHTLDIGGGNGYTSSVAMRNGYSVGIIEPNMAACHHAKMRGIEDVNCGTVTDESILDESIEQALLLDVLEHIENDEGFANLLYRKLVNEGYLLITVPAFKCLWSSEDEAAGHFRRYRIKDLCEILKKQGFYICYQSYFMGFLFFPILFVRVFLEKVGILKPQQEHFRR